MAARPEASGRDLTRSNNKGQVRMVQKIKIAGIAILALLVLIVVLQNTESVETKVLFLSVTMPRAALLFGALVAGFILGVFSGGKLLRLQGRAA